MKVAAFVLLLTAPLAAVYADKPGQAPVSKRHSAKKDFEVSSRHWGKHSLGWLPGGYAPPHHVKRGTARLAKDRVSQFPYMVRNNGSGKKTRTSFGFSVHSLPGWQPGGGSMFLGGVNKDRSANMGGQYASIGTRLRLLEQQARTTVASGYSGHLVDTFCNRGTTGDAAVSRQANQDATQEKDLPQRGDCLSLQAATIPTSRAEEKVGPPGGAFSNTAGLTQGNLWSFFIHQMIRPAILNLKSAAKDASPLWRLHGLFPPNFTYQKFLEAATPRKNASVHCFLLPAGLIFLFSSLFFACSLFGTRTRLPHRGDDRFILHLLVIAGAVGFCSISALYMDAEMNAVDAAYRDRSFPSVALLAPVPLLQIALFIPMIRLNRVVFKGPFWGLFSRTLYVLNGLFTFAMIAMFLQRVLSALFSNV